MAGIKNDPDARDNLGQLRMLIYMCRCAFAHNVLYPEWEVRGKYERRLDIAYLKFSFRIKSIFFNLKLAKHKTIYRLLKE